jgi:hypothetical protein
MDLGGGVSLAPSRPGPGGATVVGGRRRRDIAMRAISTHDFRKQATKNYLILGAKAPLCRHEIRYPRSVRTSIKGECRSGT